MLLDAIARSDGTRAGVLDEPAGTHFENRRAADSHARNIGRGRSVPAVTEAISPTNTEETTPASFRRRAAIALAGLTTAGAFAAPLAAQADAAVMLKVAGSSKFLPHSAQNGFATLKSSTAALPNEQRWDQIDAPGPGPAKFYRNVADGRCLRAHPTTNVFVRTRTCDFSGNSTASKEQQWILSGDGELVNLDQFNRGVAADALSVDFANVNRVVNLAPFTGGSNQEWTVLPA